MQREKRRIEKRGEEKRRLLTSRQCFAVPVSCKLRVYYTLYEHRLHGVSPLITSYQSH
jgi:hypothetical protein